MSAPPKADAKGLLAPPNPLPLPLVCVCDPNWKFVGGGVPEVPLVCAKGFEPALVEKLKSPPKPVPDWPDGWKEGILCGAACPKAVAVGVAARLLR